MNEITKWIVKNWDKIPKDFKRDIREPRYDSNPLRNNLPNVDDVDHEVVMLVDRQKPSVEANYCFDEERIGVTKTGKILWGFDSGCSCPSPWEDSYPNCYSCGSYKQFTLAENGFDEDWFIECSARIVEIKKAIKK